MTFCFQLQKKEQQNCATCFATVTAKQVSKECCAFNHPCSYLSCNKTVTLYTGFASPVAKQVYLIGQVKHAPCTDFVEKSRTALYFLQQPFTT